MKALVYYHNDMDGKCSAAIVKRVLQDKADLKFVPLQYDDPVELPKDIWEYWRVYILDFTLPERQMDELCNLLPRADVIWIEHHITQLVKYETKYSHLAGVRKNGVAACELTWRFMYGEFNEMPEAVMYIANRDIWKLEDENTLYFYEWLINSMGGPQQTLWELLLENKKVPSGIMERGQLLRDARINQMKKDIKSLGYDAEIDGHRCFKVNYSSYESISDAGRFICDDLGYPVAVIYHYKKNSVGKLVKIFGLRSNDDVDVSEIAVKRGGGGHKRAAGFFEIIE